MIGPAPHRAIMRQNRLPPKSLAQPARGDCKIGIAGPETYDHSAATTKFQRNLVSTQLRAIRQMCRWTLFPGPQESPNLEGRCNSQDSRSSTRHLHSSSANKSSHNHGRLCLQHHTFPERNFSRCGRVHVSFSRRTRLRQVSGRSRARRIAIAPGSESGYT